MFLSTAIITLLGIATALVPAEGAPASSTLQQSNALQAQKLNAQFASLKLTDSCNPNDQGCINGSFVLCGSGGKWSDLGCSSGSICAALPLVNAEGVTVTCDTESNALQRMQDAGVDASLTGNNTVAPSPPAASSAIGSSTTPSATASPSAGDDDDCTDDENVDIAMRAIASPSATSVSGYTRQRYVVPSVLAEIPASSSTALASASVPTVASSAILGTPVQLSTVSVPTTAAPTSTGTAVAEPDPAGDSVLVVTIETTMYVTVTVPPVAATGSASIPSATVPSASASASLTSSSSFLAASSAVSSVTLPSAVPTLSAASTVPSLGTSDIPTTAALSSSVGAASASIPTTSLSAVSSLGASVSGSVSAIPTSSVLSDSTGAAGSPSFTGRIVNTSSGVLSTPTLGTAPDSGLSASSTSSIQSSVTTILGPAPTAPSSSQAQPVTTYNSSDLSFLLTATVTPS